MEVETKNASLDTLAVTIQALHVSGKQMTLAVFRQLPIAAAYNVDGTLSSSLSHWGLVRYEIKDQCGLWVVASRGGVLYRCDADHRLESSERKNRQVEFARERIAALEDAERLSDARASWMKEYRALAFEFDATVTDNGHGINASLGRWNQKDAFIRGKLGPEPTSIGWSDRQAMDLQQYKDDLPRLLVERDRSAAAERSLKKLMSLPQLFIAV